MQKYFARSVCPYDCPDTCGLLVETDGKTVSRVKGDPDHPATRGFVCRKMQRYDLSINHADRILQPLRRSGPKGAGQFRAIRWDEALTEIADRWNGIIGEYGAQAILPYWYSGVMSVVGRNCGSAFFNYMGASNLVRTICSSGKDAGWKVLMGDTGGTDPREFADCDFMLLWGTDVTATRLHMTPMLQALRKRGVPVLLVETYRGPTSGLCDETILVRPGTDAALVLAMIRVIAEEGLADREFLAAHTVGWERLEPTLAGYGAEAMAEVTGVPADTIRRLARAYAGARAPAMVVGSGPSRYRNGAMTCRSVFLLPAVVGAWGKPGAGLAGIGPLSPNPLAMDFVTRPDFRKEPVRSINMNRLAAALGDDTLSPPIKSLYVFAANPAAVTSNQRALHEQFAREDLFTVVHERFLTDTARFADIILPATFSVEQGDIHTCFGYRTLQVSKPVVPPPGECKSNWNTFRALAKAMGYDDPYFRMTEEEMVARVLDNSPLLSEMLSAKELEDLRGGAGIDFPVKKTPPFATASGKIEIYNPSLSAPLPEYQAVEADAYPLRMVAAPSPYTLNSTFGERRDLVEQRGPMTLLVNTADAGGRGIGNGAKIRCFNELAQIECVAKVTDDVLAGTVIACGVHSPAARGGLAANALMRERLSDMGEATTMNDNGVDVAPA